jgi:hypothetical protein
MKLSFFYTTGLILRLKQSPKPGSYEQGVLYLGSEF